MYVLTIFSDIEASEVNFLCVPHPVPHDYLSTFTAALFKNVYATDVTDSHDWRILLFNIVSESLVAFTAGRYAVSFIPALAYLPGWLPGAGFQNVFKRWHAASDRARDGFYAEALDAAVRQLWIPPRAHG